MIRSTLVRFWPLLAALAALSGCTFSIETPYVTLRTQSVSAIVAEKKGELPPIRSAEKGAAPVVPPTPPVAPPSAPPTEPPH